MLTTLIFFHNTWNVNKKDNPVKCNFIFQLGSSIPVRHRLSSLLCFHPKAQINGPVLSLRSILTAQLGSGAGCHRVHWEPHCQTELLTPAGKWVTMSTNNKHQRKTLEASQIWLHKSSFVSKYQECVFSFGSCKEVQCGQAGITKSAHRTGLSF